MKILKAEIVEKSASKKDGGAFSYLELDTGISDVRSFRVVLPEGVNINDLPDEVNVKWHARQYDTKFGPKKELYLRVVAKEYTF